MLDEKLWREDIVHTSIPFFPCPSCGKGILEGSDNMKLSKGDAKAEWEYSEFGEPPMVQVFVSILTCNYKKCGNVFSCSGYSLFTELGMKKFYHEEHGSYEDLEYGFAHNFEYFYPPLAIIDLPENLPDDLHRAIFKSFSLFWCDPDACAGQIRVSIEMLLNYKKIKKTALTKRRKRKLLTLNARIDIYKSKGGGEYAESLRAIKWIGNDGSHHRTNLRRQDVADAYLILEHLLEKLYIDKEKQIKKIRKEIIKRGGARKS